jgi:hypothetical protein
MMLLRLLTVGSNGSEADIRDYRDDARQAPDGDVPRPGDPDLRSGPFEFMPERQLS